jgi:hypothetical protein
MPAALNDAGNKISTGEKIMSRTLKVSVFVLFILVFLSLSLNMYLIWQLLRIQRQAREVIPRVQETLSQAATDVETFRKSKIELEIEIDQEFPVNVEIPIKETIEVPIQVTIPIKEEFDTTVVMDPFKSGLEVPVDVTVPVDVEVPIDVVVPVTIDRTIPISTMIPLNTNFPITIDINKTNLAGSIEQLRVALISFNQFLDEALLSMQ